jgi:hypothetical protein
MTDEHEPKPIQHEETSEHNVTRRRFIGVSTGAFVAAILAACGGTAATTAPASSTAPSTAASVAPSPAASAAPSAAGQASAAPSAAPAAKKGGEFHGAWPYDVPPKGHYNNAKGVTDGIFTTSVYRDILEMPLGMYLWKEKKWLPLLGLESKFEGDNFKVTLRKARSGATARSSPPRTSSPPSGCCGSCASRSGTSSTTSRRTAITP